MPISLISAINQAVFQIIFIKYAFFRIFVNLDVQIREVGYSRRDQFELVLN